MRRLILGAGKHHIKQPGETLCDIRKFPNIDVVHNLNITPWPFQSRQYGNVWAHHLVEHLDNLISFMDEAWRVLTPGGSLSLTTPLAGGDIDLEWADPTHKRCYRLHSFINYFSLDGVEKFGYTDKAWNFHTTRVINNVIEIHAYPVKL